MERGKDLAEIPERVALEVASVTKRFGPTVALDGVSFRVRSGDVHALLGENGAGKSTLVKILSGLVTPDEGQVNVAGKRLALHSPRAVAAAGVATAFQELSLLPYFSVAQNLFLGREPRGAGGLISKRRLLAQSKSILDEWDVPEVEPQRLVSELSLAARQRLEIVRALARASQIVLLDEPTAALSAADVEWLYRQVRKVQAAGVTVIFISHRMGEIRDLCSTATVLRNGREVATFATASAGDDEVVQMMIGRSAEAEYAAGIAYEVHRAETILEIDDLAAAPDLRAATLKLSPGEILGVAALQGHGQRELFMTLFGAQQPLRGTLRIGGRLVRFHTPRDAVHAGIGLSLVPEDRKSEGVLLGMSAAANVSLPSLEKCSTAGFINRGRERSEVLRVLDAVNVRRSAVDDDVSSLSGGNQQKIAIGKWLLADARIMLMYDPTRGVDVGTKAEIFALMRRLAAEGRALLFYSTDLEELVNICNRIITIRRGRVTEEFTGTNVTKERILAAMLGTSGRAEAAS